MDAEKIIPVGKRSKKAQRKHYAGRRADWNGVVPVTRVIPNKKKRADRRKVDLASTLLD